MLSFLTFAAVKGGERKVVAFEIYDRHITRELTATKPQISAMYQGNSKNNYRTKSVWYRKNVLLFSYHRL